MKVLIVEDDSMHANYLKEIVEEALPEVTEVDLAEDGLEGDAG